jgi:hypothetical protein
MTCGYENQALRAFIVAIACCYQHAIPTGLILIVDGST